MSNAAVDHSKSSLVIEDGKAYVHLFFGPVSVGPLEGYLRSFYKIAGDYPNGDWTDIPAAYHSYYDDLIDEFNEEEGWKYPYEVSIEVTPGEEFTLVGFNVPVMGSDQPALLKIDWSNLDLGLGGDEPSVTVTLTGPAAVQVGSDIVYEVRVSEVSDLTLLDFNVAHSDNLTFKGAEKVLNLNDSYVMTNQSDSKNITWGLPGSTGLSTGQATALLSLTFEATAPGTAVVSLTGTKAFGIAPDDPGNVTQYAVNEPDAVQIEIYAESVRDEFDVDGDGKVDLLDLAKAQLYYKATTADSDWSVAEAADVNGDGEIGLDDLINIYIGIKAR
jgi:hypothetical protein